MELNNLLLLDKKFSFKLLGNLINKKRKLYGYSLETFSKLIELTPKELVLVEAGKKFITQDQFDTIKEYLDFEPQELFELNYFVESKYLINLYKALDENFPK